MTTLETPNPKTACPWQVAIVMTVIAAVTTGAYVSSFDGQFYLDDIQSIVDNPYIRNLWPLTDAMSLPLASSGATVDVRPVLSLTLAVNYAIGGTDPWGYHLLNVMIHVLAAWTMCGVVRRTLLVSKVGGVLGSRAIWVAAAATMLWAVHPLQTESVTYIVQRGESLGGLLLLASLYCVIRACERSGTGRGRWLAGATVLSLLGMGTKETLYVLPLVVVCYDAVFLSDSWRDLWRKHKSVHVLLFSTLMVGIAYRALTQNAWREVMGLDPLVIPPEVMGWHIPEHPTLAYALTQPRVVLEYLRLTVWPTNLALAYNWPLADSVADVALPGLPVVMMLVAAGVGMIRRRWWGFLLAWFFLLLSPASSFRPMAEPCHEHRMYLPLGALTIGAVVVAVVAWRGVFGQPVARKVGLAIGCALLTAVTGSLGWATWQRNAEYADPEVFWGRNTERYPDAYFALTNYAHILAGKPSRSARIDALVLVAHAVKVAPNDPTMHMNHGAVLLKVNQPRQAVGPLARAIALWPEYCDAWANLGLAHWRMAETEREDRARLLRVSARDELLKAIKLGTRMTTPYNLLKTHAEDRGLLSLAEGYYRRSLELSSDSLTMRHRLAVVLFGQNRKAEAVQQWRQMLRQDPGNDIAIRSLQEVGAATP